MSDDEAQIAANPNTNNYFAFWVPDLSDATKADILRACRIALKS